MKGFKGTDKNGKCRGFQYEENHDYEFENIELCKSGGHFCSSPLDVLEYYPLGNESRYFTVEAADEDVSPEISKTDSKRVAKKLHIGTEIGIKGLIKEHFNFVNENVQEHTEDGDFSKIIAGPKCAARVGHNGKVIAGDSGAAVAGHGGTSISGSYGAAKAGGYGTAVAGHNGAAITDYSGVAVAGHDGAAIAGDSGAAVAGGYGTAITGNYGVAIADYRGTAKAGNGGIAATIEHGTAIAGIAGVAIVDYYGTAIVDNYGTATAKDRGTAIAGNYGVATAGEYSIATAGRYGTAASRGNSSVGENGFALARGIDAKVRGGLGAILALVEEKCDGSIENWKAFIIDGENYKPNVWYQLENGEVVEVEEEDG